MIKPRTFLSYIKVKPSGLQRVLYRTKITGESHTVLHEKNEDTGAEAFLNYLFDLIENKNTLYTRLKLSDDDKVEIAELLDIKYRNAIYNKKNAVKTSIGIAKDNTGTYDYLEVIFTANGLVDTRLYRTRHPDPAGTLLSTRCGDRYELIGIYADGDYGTYEDVIDWYSTECGYDPNVPVPFILDGGRADTVFESGNAGGGGAVLPPL